MDRPEKTTPTLVFLHGVKNQGPRAEASKKWRRGLSAGLEAAGYAGIEGLDVVEPSYPDILLRLNGEPRRDDDKFPSITQPWRTPAQRKTDKTNFDRRSAAMERRLVDSVAHAHGPFNTVADKAAAMAFRIPFFRDASHYMNDETVRREVLNRIMRQLPDQGSIVLIGHSLGSVIAADLLPRIPNELKVAGMITVGSPLAQGNFDLNKLDTNLKEPPSNLEWWVNFWSGTDPVTARRGAASAVAWLLDIRVSTPFQPFAAHDAHEYLSNELVGKAVGYALYGSQSTEIAVIESGLDVQMDPEELRSLVSLRLSHLIQGRLKGDAQARFAGALGRVQHQTVDDLIEKRKMEGRPVPGALADLHTSDVITSGLAVSPRPSAFPSREDATELFTVLALQNPLFPYEIEVKDSIRVSAMRELAREMQLHPQLGEDALDAVEEASKVLAGKSWLMKWGLVGAGALAVFASGGLLLPAAPGVVGAAAVTSALASFGPGGMIGGLLTAGALVSAGSGTITAGVMSAGSTADEVEGLIHGQLSRLILREKCGLDSDENVWNMWVESERELIRHQRRLERFSDNNSIGLKETEKKLSTLRKAIRYADQHGLSPSF